MQRKLNGSQVEYCAFLAWYCGSDCGSGQGKHLQGVLLCLSKSQVYATKMFVSFNPSAHLSSESNLNVLSKCLPRAGICRTMVPLCGCHEVCYSPMLYVSCLHHDGSGCGVRGVEALGAGGNEGERCWERSTAEDHHSGIVTT